MELREPSAKYLVRPGYRQTEVGVIPEDWEITRLDQLSGFITKGATPTTYGFKWVSDGVLFLRSECVSERGLDLAQSMYISEDAHRSLRRSEVECGDLLMTITGNVGRVVRLEGIQKGNINQHIARIRVVSDEADAGYVYFALSRPEVRKRFDAITTGQAYPQIGLKQVREAEIALPPVREQQAIADALGDADALIESLEHLLAKQRLLRQATMQALLTGERRLPGFEGAWQETAVGALGHTYGGLTGKSKVDFGRGNARYIPFMNVMSAPTIDPDWLEQVDVRAGEAQNQARKGDLFFNGSSETPEEVGLCSVLMHDIDGLYLNSFCFGFRLHPQIEADALFLAYWFRSTVGRAAMSLLAQGATRYNIAKSAFLRLAIALPGRAEQTAIATVLSDLDAEIAALEARIAKARLLKQGMMQELLTGRIRLV